MDEEAMTVIHALKDIAVPGKVAQLRRATKVFDCAASCGDPIEEGEEYYCVYLCGAGLGNIKFPDRLHIRCIDHHLNPGGKNANKRP